MECRYINNVQQGVWKYYYKNGQLKDSGIIKNNQMVNTWYSWYPNGQIMAVMEYLPPDSIADNHFSFAIPQQGKTGMLENAKPRNSASFQMAFEEGFRCRSIE